MNIEQFKLLFEIKTLQQLPNSLSTKNSSNQNTNFTSMLNQYLMMQSISNDPPCCILVVSNTSPVVINSSSSLQNWNNIDIKIADEQLQPIIEEASNEY